MHDPEDEHHLVVLDGVVHDPVVTHTQSMEGIASALDRCDGPARDAARLRCISSELLERATQPLAQLRDELGDRLRRRRTELDPVWDQASSERSVVRPLA